MTSSPLRTQPARLARAGLLCGIAMMVFIAYALPFIGFLPSMGLPFMTHKFRHYLWPQTSQGSSLAWSVMAWAGLWVAGLLSIVTPVLDGPGEGGEFEVSTQWLVIPLCAPDSLNAVLLPALAAA